jgi:Mn2+/Fe2+ NRAMP family transporter
MQEYLDISHSLYLSIITSLIVGRNQNEILLFTIIPHIELIPEFMVMIVAIFGNVLSPSMLFWQTSEEAEENIAKNKSKEMGLGKPKILRMERRLVKIDVAIGMAFTVFIMWSIMVTTAGSLHFNEIYEIEIADQAT